MASDQHGYYTGTFYPAITRPRSQTAMHFGTRPLDSRQSIETKDCGLLNV